MTYPQALLWQGSGPSDLGSAGIVGSVASEYFITYRNRHLYLWQVGDPPGLRARKTLDYDIIYTAENGAGVIAGLGQSTDTGDWFIIKIWADTVQPCNIHYEAFPIAYTAPTQFWVSGDGLEYVVRTNDATNLISGYSVVDGTQNWEHDIFTTVEARRTGYVACAPRAGRYLWVNTSPLTLVYNWSLTSSSESMGAGGSTNTFSNVASLPDYVGDGETILSTKLFGKFVIGTTYYLYDTNTDELVIGGSTIIPSLSAVAFDFGYKWESYVANVIPDLAPGPISFTAYKEYADGSSGGYFAWNASYSGYSWTLEVTLDNSDRGGNFIELRDDTGAILDTIAHVDSSINPYGDPIITSWVADVDDTVTYVSGGRCGGGGT